MAYTHTFRSVENGYPTFKTDANGYNNVEVIPQARPSIVKLDDQTVRFSSGAYLFSMNVATDSCQINDTPFLNSDATAFFDALNQLYTTVTITA